MVILLWEVLLLWEIKVAMRKPAAKHRGSQAMLLLLVPQWCATIAEQHTVLTLLAAESSMPVQNTKQTHHQQQQQQH
jgi:hypothetical protein